MNENSASPISSGRLIGSCVLALILGAALPIAATMGVLMLFPLLLIGGAVLVALQCAGGWVPAGLYTGVGLGLSVYALGPAPTLILAAGLLLPALAVLPGIQSRRPFFEQLRLSIAAHAAGLVAALLIAYVTFGSGMVARLMDGLRAQFAMLPDEFFAPFVEVINSTLAGSGLSGITGMTVDAYRGSLNGVLDVMEITYGQTLPGVLLSAALIGAVLTPLWGNWRMALRGLATEESFIGMSRWFLPANISLGALGLWAVGLVLSLSGYKDGQTVYTTIYMLFRLVFTVQGIASMDRRMLVRGVATRRRKVLLTIAFVAGQIFELVSFVLVLQGLASAMFGSNGALGKLKVITRRGGDDDDNDNDDQ